MLATFTAKVATLNVSDLRNLYTELFRQEMPFECIDVVLTRLMDLEGVEAVEAFIDSVA
jgi:arylamine N-acetyltransferase